MIREKISSQLLNKGKAIKINCMIIKKLTRLLLQTTNIKKEFNIKIIEKIIQKSQKFIFIKKKIRLKNNRIDIFILNF